MANSLIAKRYARGLFKSAAGDMAKAKQYQETLEALAELFGHAQIFKVFKNPAIPTAFKFEILEKAIKPISSDKGMLNFLQTLTTAGRLAEMIKISREYNSIILATEGILRAELVTAVPIQEQHRKDIKSNLEERFKRKIELEVKVDRNILGGFVVRIGNSIIDLSLKSKLDKIALAAVS